MCFEVADLAVDEQGRLCPAGVRVTLVGCAGTPDAARVEKLRRAVSAQFGGRETRCITAERYCEVYGDDG